MCKLAILRRTWKRIRNCYKDLVYRAGVATGRLDPLIPPEYLHSVGDGDFVAVGKEFLRHFTELANLQPDERILDIGCGTGRMTRPIAHFLKSGSYDGIDIVAPSIAWCQRAYASRFPNFRFHFLDAFNKVYNPSGKQRACDYRFPFDDAAFSFVFLTSVFTHMLPKDMENYLREIARMLKPGGRCLITYFLLNLDSLRHIGQGLTQPSFPHEAVGCRIWKEKYPEAAVAYEESRIRALYQSHGLQVIEPIRFGFWSGREDGLSYQDIVLARKVF
jgi:SAM-dependent methyltransferase